MIKTLTRFVAGLTAAAALLLAAGCTNQLDYVDDTTALNKMWISGFAVTGLDASYNGAKARLMVVEGDNEFSIGEATVADYTETEALKSGTVHAEFAKPYLFDGDALHTSKISLYMVVGTKSFKIANTTDGKYENAKLSVVSSPAGTSNANLAKRYISVSVYDGVPEYSFATSITKPLAIPVYMCDFNISTAVSEEDLPKGVTIKTDTKKGTNSKYTVIFKGLVDNVGTKFVVAGASISSTDSNLGDNWNIMETAGIKVGAVVTDKGLVKEVDKDGNLTFEFYGTKPAWADSNSPAIKIAAYNVDEDPWVCLLAANGGNFFFPNYTAGKDVTMTVDITTLATDNWTKSDSKYEPYTVYIDGIHIINAPTENPNSKIFLCSGDGDVPWHNWVPDNGWGVSSHSYTSAALRNGGYGWIFDTPVEVKPTSETFNLGIQITKPKAQYITKDAYDKLNKDSKDWDANCYVEDTLTLNEKETTVYYVRVKDDKTGVYDFVVDSNDFWTTKIGGSALYTNTLKTSEYTNKHYIFVVNVNDQTAVVSLVPLKYSSISDCLLYTFEKIILKNFADDNIELIGNFCGWDSDPQFRGVKSGSDIVFDISSVSALAEHEVGFKIRTVGTWGGEVNIGPAEGEIGFPIPSRSGKFNCEITVDNSKGDVKTLKAVAVN